MSGHFPHHSQNRREDGKSRAPALPMLRSENQHERAFAQHPGLDRFGHAALALRPGRRGDRMNEGLRPAMGKPVPDVALAAEQITKAFDGVLALSGVDFDLRRGEITCSWRERRGQEHAFENPCRGAYRLRRRLFPDGAARSLRRRARRGKSRHCDHPSGAQSRSRIDRRRQYLPWARTSARRDDGRPASHRQSGLGPAAPSWHRHRTRDSRR